MYKSYKKHNGDYLLMDAKEYKKEKYKINTAFTQWLSVMFANHNYLPNQWQKPCDFL